MKQKGQAIIEYIFLLTLTLFVTAFILKLIVKEHLINIPEMAIEALELFFKGIIEGTL